MTRIASPSMCDFSNLNRREELKLIDCHGDMNGIFSKTIMSKIFSKSINGMTVKDAHVPAFT